MERVDLSEGLTSNNAFSLDTLFITVILHTEINIVL